MYSVGVKDHMMIAHSFKGEDFGPAQEMHGATYVVEAEFQGEKLDGMGLLIDICRAQEILKGVLSELNYKNLDRLPEFSGKNTTTEYLSMYVHRRISEQVREVFSGRLKVTLHESHVAWAHYEDEVR